jgi:hypothetical protein
VPVAIIEMIAGDGRAGLGRGGYRFDRSRLSDSHVHAGGAVPFEDCVEQLLAGSTSSDQAERLANGAGLDVAGQRIDVNHAAMCIRVAVEHLRSSMRSSLPDTWRISDMLALLSWERLSESQTSDLSSEPSRAPVDPTASPTRWADVLSVLRGGNGNPEVRSFLLLAVCILNRVLTTSDVASLDVFVGDFRRWPDVPSTFESAFRSSAKSVTRLELRKTFLPGTSVGAIRSKADAFIASASTYDDVVPQMPLGFLKDVGSEADPHVIRGQFALSRAFVEFLVGLDHDVRPHFWAFDVAGNETLQQSFVFVNCFNIIRSELEHAGVTVEGNEPVFSAHAGESFDHPLSGVRAIHEFCTFGGVKRIGHALALDVDEMGRRMISYRSLPPRAFPALLDLCWSIDLADRTPGLDLDSVASGALIGDVIRSLSDTLFPGLDPDVEDLIAFYRLMFNCKHFEAFASHLPFDPISNTSRCLLGDVGNVPFELVHAVYHPHCFSRVDLRRHATSTVHSRQVRDLQSTLYERLVPYVIQDLRSESVTIEACPTSNCRLGRLGFGGHPLGSFLKNDLLCSISTDDPGLFSTSIDDEYLSIGAYMDPGALEQILSHSYMVTAQPARRPIVVSPLDRP